MRISSLSAFLIGVFLTMFVTGIALYVGIYIQDKNYQGKILPSIFMDGHDISGKTLKELKKYYENENSALKNIQIEIVYKGQNIATVSGNMMALRTSGTSVADQAYLITRSGNDLNKIKQKLQALTRVRKFIFTSSIEYSMVPITDALDLLEKQYNISPKNALFEFKNGKTTGFAVEQDGLKIEKEKTIGNLRKILSDKNISGSQSPITIQIESRIVKPEITLAKANDLGIEEIVGFGTSDYSDSIPERIHNILLATQRLHGTVILKGESFSYNNSVGEISVLTGYKPAYVIINGRTVLGDGGGVCQTSTTIFRATLNSGLPVTQWFAHAYRVHYYENDGKPGRDATVYSPSVDFQFKNDTPSAILIQTEVDKENKILKYTLWGKKDGRKIEISDVVLQNPVATPPPREEEDPTLKKGVRKQVDWAASGLTTWFDYRVTKGENVIQEKRFTSFYRPWQAVYLVGTAE